jgi:copper(I)-binding protein
LRFSLPAYRDSRGARILLGCCAGGVVALSAAGCSASSTAAGSNAAASGATASAAPQPRGSASAAGIVVSGAYIPQPATADVAAAYFTITDTGGRSDVLTSATSVPSAQASLMSETTSGGAETMTMLPGGLTVPAHGSVTLAPDGDHLMLTDPATALKQGGTVELTLHFEHAGTVRIAVPVTSLLSDAMTSPGASATATGMAGMPGM